MRRRQALWIGTAALAAAGGLAGWRDYAATLDAAHAAVAAAGRPRRFVTRHGPCEVAETGHGPPLLMIHGTGGGYDQGLRFAAPLAARGWRVIAPSRFGYLGTPFPSDPGPEAQADALADLLDGLGIARAAIVGGSAGAIPALAFALRHPGRTAALIPMVPATFVPGRPAPPPPDTFARWMIETGLRSDLLFWAALRLSEDRLIAALLATDPARVSAASAAEQARVRAILHGILPVSLRYRGLLNDARWAADPPDLPLSGIRAPTLAISAEDDRFGTAAAARHIGSTVPGAQALVLPDGGHVWVGHNDAVMGAADAFLRRHLPT